ncbi:hypothetical protein GCM10011344_20550 [Dokdonia pacifica]|uniref:Uncharacterized protein n=1 Tax=Dokdonia pacifica TaxID=1627892 RepID=A0A238VNH0_9FLAO|nr:hypothetical protein [Dokdonia pacifica]GGG19741.1 hypothetical protein GCM10011344_20550 [Dokdonia pacifica]SNR35687.1 hypothetical protein SAMN06265376_10177 [Dokdonia pacifica]
MKPLITRKTVGTYLRQTYALNEQQLFDNKFVSQEMRNEILTNLLEEFSSSFYGNGKLIARDPFTKKDISLTTPDFDTINTMDSVMKLLSDTHKQRMETIDRYRKQHLQSLERTKELEIEEKKQTDITIER